MARTPNNHHVLPLFCDDLIASCVDMTPSRFGAYMRLLCYAWTRGGLPNDEAACGRIAGGFESGDWEAIRSRLVLIDDGEDGVRLTHQRLELERQKVAELREKKAAAGKLGGRPKANGKQTESKTKAGDTQKGKQNESKTKAPTPTPTLLENTHTAREAESEFRKPGWAADEWAAFVAVWNSTERAARWTLLTAPDGWVDSAASPGWLDKARAAVNRLPRCRHFGNPLAVTQLLKPGFVDRILAGEFDNSKSARGQPDEKPPPKAWRDEYRPAPYRTPKEVAALADAIKLKDEDT